jgi:hypothetical protein
MERISFVGDCEIPEFLEKKDRIGLLQRIIAENPTIDMSFKRHPKHFIIKEGDRYSFFPKDCSFFLKFKKLPDGFLKDLKKMIENRDSSIYFIDEENNCILI